VSNAVLSIAPIGRALVFYPTILNIYKPDAYPMQKHPTRSTMPNAPHEQEEKEKTKKKKKWKR
jgi:hypothetical protein